MLAHAGSGTPPLGAGWLHEVKWDGVRAILARDEHGVAIRSRSGREMVATYPELAVAANSLEPGFILDGEIVTLNREGVPSFELLQRRMNLRTSAKVSEAVQSVPVTYIVFDLLHHPGGSLLRVPLEERLARLAVLDLPQRFVPSECFDDPGPLQDFVSERHLEGILSKRRRSVYRPGTRTSDWIKTVAFKSLRAIVGGFTSGEGGRRDGFGALILGLPTSRGLRWIGSVGSGFTETDLRAIRQALEEMAVPESPFELHPDMPGGITWVAPALVAVVQYKEWTTAGRLRGPSFKGFTDYPVTDVTWDAEGPEAPGG
jgi:bifunctional non-homologous end joining protein LigD